MSDQEKTSGENISVVMVEQTASSRHKSYRPIDLQEEAKPDLHKRSRAPAVPSLTEELKDAPPNKITDTIDHNECERVVSSERQTHPSKKLSSSKRRGSSPEAIAMVLMDAQKDTLPQPIPDHNAVVSMESAPKLTEKTEQDKKADVDSITEDNVEIQTSDPLKEHSEWVEQPTHSNTLKKKEITWEDIDLTYLQNVNAKSQAALLERKASVGPCFKPKMLYGGPSGITVCVPKKSVRNMKEDFNPIQSVINFNITKKMESKSICHMEARYEKMVFNKVDSQKQSSKKPEKELKITPHPKFFDVLRCKIDNVTSKIRNLLNM